MRFKKAISSFLAGLMVFGNALLPTAEWAVDMAVPALRLSIPALVGGMVLNAKVVYARTTHNWVNASYPLKTLDGNMSNDPTDAELAGLHGFAVSFYPLSGPEQPNENHDLALAIHQTLLDGSETRGEHLEAFIKAHPKSRWVLAAALNDGLLLYRMGHFSKALTAFYKACIAGGSETKSRPAAALADRALAEALRMNCRVGRLKMAKFLLAKLEARRPSGMAARYCEDGIRAVSTMENKPDKAFFCGPYALQSILAYQNSPKADSPVIKDAKSTQKGYALDDLWDMSEQLGMNLQIAKRSPGAKVITPAVVNWKLNHYAALVEQKNGLIHSVDPTFGSPAAGSGRSIWLSAKTLDEEGSGYYLVPEGPLPAGWSEVGTEEASKVFGRGFTGAKDDPPPCPPQEKGAGESGDVGSSPAPPCPPINKKMPVADIDLFTVSPTLADTPLWYQPPIGPEMDMGVYYDAEDVVTLPFSNFGINWSCNWISYIDAGYLPGGINNGPVTFTPTGNMTLYNPGGGVETFFGFGQPTKYSNTIMTSMGQVSSSDPNFVGMIDSAIQRQMPDGSSQIYGMPIFVGGLDIVRYLLTQVIDPHGNVTTLNYDSNYRLTSIVDASGQSMTFNYGNSFSPYLITQVGDSFGRSANFEYDNQGNMTAITDMGGIRSQMTYNVNMTINPYDIVLGSPEGNEPQPENDLLQDSPNGVAPLTNNTFYPVSQTEDVANGRMEKKTVIFSADDTGGSGGAEEIPIYYLASDWIATLTTPYGTTTFQYGIFGFPVDPQNVYVQITDPLGEKEKVAFYQPGGSEKFDNDPVPTGIQGIDTFNAYRNTYVWGKQAMDKDPDDLASAKRYHWLHSVSGGEIEAPIIESLTNPNESTIWYSYPGMTDSLDESSANMPNTPIVVSRFTNNTGTQQSQEHQFAYNPYGKVTNYIDPTGRSFTYTYAPNGQDMVAVQDGQGEYLAQYTYDSAHDPLSYTDASGQTWHYSYNTAGEILSVSAPLGETTHYNYDGNGFLVSVVPPQPGSTITYTYDNIGRVRTQTTAAQGTLTYSYNNLDQVTNIAYSDGTHESYSYTNLDVTKYTDRQTRSTNYGYDADRHMTSVTDPNIQTTQFGWCACGSLASMTDPKGNKTTWNRDFEGRVIGKIYADQSAVSYNYDQNGSQLLSVTDARNETTNYTYDLDNELATVVYSGPVTGTANVNFSYDPVLPRLSGMSDGTGSTSYSYYPIGSTGGGHVQTVVSPVGTTTANITYVYDNDGRTKSRSIDSNGESYTYSNDELVNVTNPLGSFGYTYDATTSNLTQINYPNGQKTTMAYYQPTNPIGAGRLQTLTNTGAGSTAGQTLSAFNYTYTQAGDINTWTQQLDNAPTDAKTYTMGYDRDSQLKSATLTSGTSGFDGLTANKGVTFGYDASGNRTSEQTSTYSHGFGTNNLNQLTNITPNPIPVKGSTNRAASVVVNGQTVTEDSNNNYSATITPVGNSTPMTIQAIASDGTQTTQKNHVLNTEPYTYDANGNLTQDDKYSYVWDAENRLIQVNFLNPQPTTKPDTVQMTYDGQSRRVSVTELHGTTVINANTYIWCGRDSCQERDSTGHTVVKQFFSQGEQINGTNYYFVCDHLGSVRQMTDSSGAVHASYDYDMFGRQIKLLGDQDADFGYTGFGIEKTLGFDMTMYRIYDPEKGRWISRDPAGEEVGFNLYEYVNNKSLVYRDLLGLDTTGASSATNTPGNNSGDNGCGSNTPTPTSCPTITPSPTPTPTLTPTPLPNEVLLNHFVSSQPLHDSNSEGEESNWGAGIGYTMAGEIAYFAPTWWPRTPTFTPTACKFSPTSTHTPSP